MRPSEALSLHRAEVLEVLSRYRVENPRVFGSVARGDDDEGSDLDLLVDNLPGFTLFQYGQLIEELEFVTQKKVDVVTASSLNGSPNFLERVTKEAIQL
ncbi:nucleotidyltransferase family protein [Acidithiobacillus thiooxidans]|uniref:nucleotidyltransferase family protein n=1 Tax=Acidithiobacillus thiooxidans TaxID=930 RepID=UPI001C07A5D6|nr:nucleotidyltransferase family protein [Acidithiobacillus thiooxidans]MBU2792603.1 nucleotidyltransferase family protein [Acidithiobacillus thiooxidans]